MILSKASARYIGIYNKINDLYYPVAQRHGISATALNLLYMVCITDEPCTQNELAKALCIPKQTVNSAVSKLVKDGFLELVQRPGPRNSKTVQLTEQGMERCREFVLPLIEAEDRALARMTGEEQELFLSLYEKRYQYLKEEMGRARLW